MDKRDKAIMHKDESIKRLDLSFLKHIDAEDFKTSNLLAYWIKDYAKYHDEEKTFDTTKLITFKRGNIIKVNLGFKIGNELGGLHYCIVLDKHDNPKNGTLTVIPLTSYKNKKYPNSSIDLGNELFEELNNIYEKEYLKIKNKYNNIWNLPAEQLQYFTSQLAYVSKIKEEIDKMKKGSIALTNQITTISKQRIFDDKVLRKVRLSDNSLNLLDKKILDNFTK